MVDVRQDSEMTRVEVQAVQQNNPVTTANNLAEYFEHLAKEHAEESKEYSDLAKDWATKLNETVDGKDYSSKEYALRTKAEHEEALIDIDNSKEFALREITSSKEISLSDISDAKDDSLQAINNIYTSSETSLLALKNESLTQIGSKTSEGVETLNTEAATHVSELNSKTNEGLGKLDTTLSESLDNLISKESQLEVALNSYSDTKKSEINTYTETKKSEIQPYVTQAQTYANNSKASADNAHTSELACLDVLNKIGTAIKIKGRVDTFADLPKTGNLDGDAYLVGLEGLDSYPEYYWFQNHWEFLGTSSGGGTWGTITGDITTQTDLQIALDGKQPTGDYALKSELPSLEGYATESYVQGYHDSTKQDVITDLATIRDGASKGATALQSIPIARANVVGGVAGGNWLTVNQTTGKMECGELSYAQYSSALGYTFISKTTLENVLTNKGYITSSYHDSTKQDTLNITLLEGAEQW